MPTPSDRVSLDTSVEPWIGTFPGLGEVRVHADGAVEVQAAQVPVDQSDDAGDPDTTEDREMALRHGWGEPLSLARRGYQCLGGAAAVPPGDGSGCLLLSGDPHDTAIVLLALSGRGWSVLADRVVPALWHEGVLTAHPREASVLASRRRVEKSGHEGAPARAGSDAVQVDIGRAVGPHAVRAIAALRVRRPEEAVLERVDGHRAFELVAGLAIAGALAPDDERSPAERMAAHVRLTALPLAWLHLDAARPEPDIDELCDWWATSVGNSTLVHDPTAPVP